MKNPLLTSIRLDGMPIKWKGIRPRDTKTKREAPASLLVFIAVLAAR